MSAPGNVDPADWARQVFPVDGPHDPARVIAAAAVVGELCRYLAHATLLPVKDGLPAPRVYSLLAELGVAARSLEQVVGQLAARAGVLRTDPTLRADSLGPPRTPRELAGAALTALDAATVLCGSLARALGKAQNRTARLYHDDPDSGAR